MNVTLVGYFRELRHGLDNGPSLSEAVGKGQYLNEKGKLISYLNAGLVYSASPGIGVDVLSSEGKMSGPIHSRTDGRWMWPSDLSYYVENYDVAVPEEFLASLRQNNWQTPRAEGINILEIVVVMP